MTIVNSTSYQRKLSDRIWLFYQCTRQLTSVPVISNVCCILYSNNKVRGYGRGGIGIKCKLLHLDPLRGFLEMLGGGTAGGRLFPWGVAGAEPDDPACFCLSETTLIILTSSSTSPSTDGPFFLSLRVALLCTLVVPIRILMTFALSMAFQSVPEGWEYFK